jgi:hypothetical protein
VGSSSQERGNSRQIPAGSVAEAHKEPTTSGAYKTSPARLAALARVRGSSEWARGWRTRFLSRFIPEPNSGCHLWEGANNSNGYGVVGLRRKDGVTFLGTHRVAFALARPEWDGEGGLLHSCDQPLCGNPEHLRVGTRSENALDAVMRGRANRTIDRERIRRLVSEGIPGAEIAARVGCSYMSVLRCVGGAR